MAAQSDIEAGSAFVRLYLKSANVSAFFDQLGKRIKAFSQRLNTMGKRMAVTAIVMAMPFVAGTKVFADFSKQMAFVSTMLDDSTKYMKGYTKAVRDLSVEFGEGTEAISRGLYDILSAGFSADRAIGMLNITMKAGKAGMADAASATKAIIAVLNAYGLSAEYAREVSDTLFQTVRYGVLTFGELAGHIGLVAPSAAQAGVSLNELGATLAIITRSGIETSHAVVALNNILKAFMAPTGAGAAFAKKLKEAGFAFEMSIAGIKRAGFANIIAEIGKLPTEAIAKLFPSIRSQRGILAVKSGLQALPMILERMNEKLGATDRAFAKVRKTFGYFLDQVKQAGIVILSYIGEAVGESLKGIQKDIVLITKGIGKWIEKNKGLVKTIVKLIVGFGLVAVTMMIISKVLAVVAGLMTLIAFTTGSWLGALLGLAAAAAIYYGVKKVLSGIAKEMKHISREGANMGTVMKKSGKDIYSYLNILKANRLELEKTLPAMKAQVSTAKKLEDFHHKLTGGALARAQERKGIKPGLFGDYFDPEAYVKSYSYAMKLWKAHKRNWKLAREETGILRTQWRRREEQLRQTENAIEAEERRLGMFREQTKQVEKQAKAMGRFRYGHFLGFWHTPALSFATATSGDQQVDLLREIRDNTGEAGPLVTGIKEISRTE